MQVKFLSLNALIYVNILNSLSAFVIKYIFMFVMMTQKATRKRRKAPISVKDNALL